MLLEDCLGQRNRIRRLNVKTAIIAALLATAIVSPSSAGSWLKTEHPCGSKCSPPKPTPPGGWNVRAPIYYVPDYVSRSTMVITHSDGSTSTINSTYQSYR
jgi:hypothetical protein